jgi:hypothetical protein
MGSGLVESQDIMHAFHDISCLFMHVTRTLVQITNNTVLYDVNRLTVVGT